MRVDYRTLKTIAEICGNDFDITFSSDKVYLRFSYWQKLSETQLEQIKQHSIVIEENEYEDDECGYLYSYTI